MQKIKKRRKEPYTWEKYILHKRKKRKEKRRFVKIQKEKEKIKDAGYVKKREYKSLKRTTVNIIVSAFNSLSMFNNPENVIDLIERIHRQSKVAYFSKNIEIDLSAISEIDIGGISILLAKVNEISKNRKIRIWGRAPNEERCRDIFRSSGFLDYMTDLSGRKFQKHSDNFIVNVGTDRTRNKTVGNIVEKSLKYLGYTETVFPPVYSIIQEIVSNSVEWANQQLEAKNWFLGANHIEINGQKRIQFLITDIGFGILNTINRKFATILQEYVSNASQIDILEQAFLRKYGSKTKETNRNKGLPLIRDRFAKMFIKDLIVITNNVELNFAFRNKSKILGKNFSGTFYSWIVDADCIENWKLKSTL
jgi:hypothetical protein